MKKILITLSLVLVTCSIQAESKPWWKFWESVDQAAGVTDRLFSAEEKRILGDFLKSQGLSSSEDDDSDDDGNKKGKKKKKKQLPPGLKKKLERGGELPPGWQKKVARGEVLDGDLYEASRNLPKGILDKLPNAPDGTSVRQVEDRVVRILDATGEILDVLTNR